jgi:multidrug resistance efflux pump
MRRLGIGASVLLLAAVAVTLGFFWPFHHRAETLRLPGVVEIQEVRLGSKIGGRVAEVAVTEGQLVQPGQLLVRFEEPELEAQQIQQRARVAQMQADLDKAINGPRPEEIRQARADLSNAEANLKQTEPDFDRAERLYKQGSMARADYDAARAARDRAQANVASFRAKLDLLLAGTRKEDIDLARAQLDEAKGKLKEIEANLAEAFVRAPERAVVDVLAVRKGDLVPPNQPVVRVLRADDLWVKVYVPETELGKVRLNQSATVTIDAYPGRQFTGTVIFIGSESEFTPRNIQSVDERRHQVFGIKVRVADPQGIFKSGMAAEVTFEFDESGGSHGQPSTGE